MMWPVRSESKRCLEMNWFGKAAAMRLRSQQLKRSFRAWASLVSLSGKKSITLWWNKECGTYVQRVSYFIRCSASEAQGFLAGALEITGLGRAQKCTESTVEQFFIENLAIIAVTKIMKARENIRVGDTNTTNDMVIAGTLIWPTDAYGLVLGRKGNMPQRTDECPNRVTHVPFAAAA